MKLLFFILFFAGHLAQASFLQMIGDADLRVRSSPDGLTLTGIYSIKNQGDELAKNVFPVLKIDNFSLSLEKRMIFAGEKFVWKVDAKIPSNQLCLKISETCPVVLPNRGDIAVRIDKQYQDANGYPFSAPEVLVLSTEQKGISSQSSEYGMLIVTTENQGNGLFKVEYDVKNMTDSLMEVEIQPVLPEQMRLQTQVQTLKIGPKAGLLTYFLFRNEKALDGSIYQIPVVARWKDAEGYRRSLSQIGGIKVQSSDSKTPSAFEKGLQILYQNLEFLKSDKIFWIFWVGFLALASLAMYFFWIKPYRKLKL
jgi:hypothetical protein